MPLLNYRNIQRRLGITFRRKALLRLALTHSSFGRNGTTKRLKSNETLEFLGDAVLELVVREYLYKKNPESTEGELNEIKVKYTNTDMLHGIGCELRIGDYLLMDKGEALTGGRERPKNIAGAVEAVIGAAYLDGGLAGARRFIKKHVLQKDVSEMHDYKSLLNQWAMKEQRRIGYRVAKSHGPPHRKIFHVDLYVDKKKITRGSGDSKKKAQQAAAKKFFEQNPILDE